MGLQIVGVHYRDSTNGRPLFEPPCERLRSIAAGPASCSLMRRTGWVLPRKKAFRCNSPANTHGGQFFSFTWIASRLYGKFVYGLQRLGNLMVYTSYGAGTWGPPLRVWDQA